MSIRHNIQLPDSVYGAVTLRPEGDKELSMSIGPGDLIHAHIGGMYIAMTQRNWRVLFATMETLEIDDKPRTFRLVVDDENRTAEVTA